MTEILLSLEVHISTNTSPGSREEGLGNLALSCACHENRCASANTISILSPEHIHMTGSFGHFFLGLASLNAKPTTAAF